MENTEDFLVELFDGSSWVTLDSFVFGSNVSNNTFYNPNINVTSGQVNFSSSAQVRFRCDASGNGDRIYVDEVVISAR